MLQLYTDLTKLETMKAPINIQTKIFFLKSYTKNNLKLSFDLVLDKIQEILILLLIFLTGFRFSVHQIKQGTECGILEISHSSFGDVGVFPQFKQ